MGKDKCKDKRKDFKVIVQHENQDGEMIELHGIPTTHKRAVEEATRFIRMGNKARVRSVSSQSLLPHS